MEVDEMLFPASEHASHPPSSWVVVKHPSGVWHLTTSTGEVLDRFKTKKAAEAEKVSGFLVKLYTDEGRWYAGGSVNGWKPYIPKGESK